MDEQILKTIEEVDASAQEMAEAHMQLNKIRREAEAKEKAYRIKLETAEGKALINKFLIGCDPEFVGLGSSGRIVYMNNFFPEKGKIGYDHGGAVGEFRPLPGKYAWTIIRRLKELIGDTKTVEGKLRAGAYVPTQESGRNFVTLGGHVHIDLDPYTTEETKHPFHRKSIPYEVYDQERYTKYGLYAAAWDTNSPTTTSGRYTNVILTGSGVQKVLSKEHTLRVKALDEYTRLLEHLDILPKKECESRRNTSDYGKYGDVRIQASGKAQRMEYRTMASWLYDPIVSFLCLTGAKVAAAEPEYTLETIGGKTSYLALLAFVDRFADKDMDCARLAEKYLPKGLKAFQVDPNTDIRERWDV